MNQSFLVWLFFFVEVAKLKINKEYDQRVFYDRQIFYYSHVHHFIRDSHSHLGVSIWGVQDTQHMSWAGNHYVTQSIENDL